MLCMEASLINLIIQHPLEDAGFCLGVQKISENTTAEFTPQVLAEKALEPLKNPNIFARRGVGQLIRSQT